MTARRDRRSDPDADAVPAPWDVRPIVGERRGLPWWGAVLLTFGLAAVGAIVNLQIQDGLGSLFKGCYFVGSVGAVCAVQRRSLFGPMVQPPLILAITVPGVVLLASGLPTSSDTLAKALAVGRPLIDGFPTMAVTTCTTLLVGIVRLYRERNPYAPAKLASDSRRLAGQAKPGDGKGPRADAAGRGTAARSGQRPAEGRTEAARRGTRDGEGGGRGDRTPPPPGTLGPRQPRRPRPDEVDRRPTGQSRSGGGPGTGRGRRVPPRPDDPHADGPDGPWPAPGRRANPPGGNRPWDNDN